MQQNSSPIVTRSESSESVRTGTIGLLGGMGPESTVYYYQRINDGVLSALGSNHSARISIHSADLQQVFDWLEQGDEAALANYLVEAARQLEAVGAEFLVMACNTAHLVAPQVEAAVNIPFVHIADVLGERLRRDGIRRLGLLSSRVTARYPFYRQRLQVLHGIETLLPDEEGIEEVHRVIEEELCHRIFRAESAQELEKLAMSMRQQGAQAIALACTELGLLIEGPELAGLPIYDTAALHAEKAVELYLDRKTASRSGKAA